jgi:large subunit ribosomal protein L5
MSRLKEKFFKEVIPEMKKKFGYKNDLAVPRVQKVVVNAGVGKSLDNKKLLDQVVADLAAITGQKPILKLAKKSISGFKIREGIPVGVAVTLRGERMYEFLDRLISVSVPRIRDFRGLPADSFDGRGNYSIGIREHIVFPEINTDSVTSIFGLQITVVTSAGSDKEAKNLLISLGFPIVKNE